MVVPNEHFKILYFVECQGRWAIDIVNTYYDTATWIDPNKTKLLLKKYLCGSDKHPVTIVILAEYNFHARRTRSYGYLFC